MQVDRRGFVRLTAAGVVGATVSPSKLIAAPLPVYGWLGGLVKSVAYSIIGSTIYDVLKELVTGNATRFGLSEIRNTGQRGFSTEESVFGPKRAVSRDPYYVCPMVCADEPIEGAMQFLSLCGCGYSAGLLSGPTLVSLNKAAADIAILRGVSRPQLHHALMPTVQDSAAFGRFCRPYAAPDMYRTADGSGIKVEYAYEDNEDHGHAAFSYYKPGNWSRPLFYREYQLPLPQA